MVGRDAGRAGPGDDADEHAKGLSGRRGNCE